MNTILDRYSGSSDLTRILSKIFMAILLLLVLIFLLNHIEFATVTGTPYNFDHTDSHTDCSFNAGTKTEECTTYSATYSFRIFANDKEWFCDVSEYEYIRATITNWATTRCWAWKK